MKIIKVRVSDSSMEDISNFKKELGKLFETRYLGFRRVAGHKGRIDGVVWTQQPNPVKENQIKQIADKYFKDYTVELKEDKKAREDRIEEWPSHGWDSKTVPYYYYLNVSLGESDTPAAGPRKKYEKSSIDREKVRQAVQDINKKFPLDIGGLPIKRAGWNEKKGQVYIDCEVPQGQLGQFKKDTFIPFIRKYFPQNKIRFYDIVHMDRGLTWIIFRYYILEK